MVVKELRPLRNELGPDIALRTVWETLDQTYYCPTSPTQTLLKKLTQGPDVRAQDATALLSFMLQCQSALALHRHKPIASLEDHTTMDAIVGRLDKVLRREWFTHLQTLPTHHAHMPTFKHFAAWIQQKTQIARLDRSSRLDSGKNKPSSDRAHADATPIFLTASAHQPSCSDTSPTSTPTASPTSTPPGSPQPAQSQEIAHAKQSPMPKAQRSTPGGDKEYRDITRRKPYPPDVFTFNANTPKEAYHAPRRTDDPDASWCAWCTEQGATYNHTTANCIGLRLAATANDQWKVINKYKVCSTCLDQGHYWRDCPNKDQRKRRCITCGNSHHHNLQCIPPKQPSTYPDAG